MDLTKLVSDLDAAVDDVGSKKAALIGAQMKADVAIAKARADVDAASQAFNDSVGKAKDLRRQLNKTLDAALVESGETPGIIVNG